MSLIGTQIGNASGTVTTADIIAAGAELVANKATDFSTINNTLYPSVQATANAIAAAVVGLLDLRGAYDASGNTFPATGGSGTAGAILKGDYWIISVAGTMGGTFAPVGSSVYALVDTPGQTAGNWAIIVSDTVWGAITGTLSNQTDLQNALNAKAVAPVVSVKTSAYPVVVGDINKIFTNEGATASVDFTLPSAAANLSFSFYTQDADGLSVIAAAGDTIRISASATPTAGNVSSVTVGSWITLTAINATEWIASVVSGTWIVSV